MSGKKVGMSYGEEKGTIMEKKKKAIAALGQTEEDIDEDPQCN